MNDLAFAARGSDGLTICRGFEHPKIVFQQTVNRKQAKENGQPQLQIKCQQFSADGKYFAYCDGIRVVVLSTETWQPHLTLEGTHGKTSAVQFSPNSSYFCTWNVLFGTASTNKQPGAKPVPNLFVFDLRTKQLVVEFVDKNRQNWQFHWTDDESVCARLVGSELLFHENNAFAKYCCKLVMPKMADYALSTPSRSLHVAAYVPVGRDTPAIVKVFRYPDFTSPIAAKTFFKADRVSMLWNKKGSALIVMAITDIDSTGQSYYGEQNLYFINTNGDSYMIPLAKNGPVYCVEWNPNSTQYCVVYGYMPAKATLYNLKGDPIFDFGTGPRNEAQFDPFGKVLCLCGFGNLRGNMEFWDCTEDKKRLNQMTAEDTTVFRWCSDGQSFLTATTAPRLRVNNGWKMWRYDGTKGANLQTPNDEELWEISWQPCSDLPEKPILPCKLQTQGANVAGAGAAYVPPHMRAADAGRPKFKLHEIELSTNEKILAAEKMARASKKKGKSQTGPVSAATTKRRTSDVQSSTVTDADKDKKVKNLNKKLEQIAILKRKLDQGEKLELNQVEKIDKEQSILDELAALTL